jgi:hypothetical protein
MSWVRSPLAAPILIPVIHNDLKFSLDSRRAISDNLARVWRFIAAIAARLEVSGRWTADPVPELSFPPATPERVIIGRAVEAFSAKCKGRDIQPTAFAEYQTFTNQLGAYCDRRGHQYFEQVTVTDLDRFYASWNDGIRGKAKASPTSRSETHSEAAARFRRIGSLL